MPGRKGVEMGGGGKERDWERWIEIEAEREINKGKEVTRREMWGGGGRKKGRRLDEKT